MRKIFIGAKYVSDNFLSFEHDLKFLLRKMSTIAVHYKDGAVATGMQIAERPMLLSPHTEIILLGWDHCHCCLARFDLKYERAMGSTVIDLYFNVTVYHVYPFTFCAVCMSVLRRLVRRFMDNLYKIEFDYGFINRCHGDFVVHLHF